MQTLKELAKDKAVVDWVSRVQTFLQVRCEPQLVYLSVATPIKLKSGVTVGGWEVSFTYKGVTYSHTDVCTSIAKQKSTQKLAVILEDCVAQAVVDDSRTRILEPFITLQQVDSFRRKLQVAMPEVEAKEYSQTPKMFEVTVKYAGFTETAYGVNKKDTTTVATRIAVGKWYDTIRDQIIEIDDVLKLPKLTPQSIIAAARQGFGKYKDVLRSTLVNYKNKVYVDHEFLMVDGKIIPFLMGIGLLNDQDQKCSLMMTYIPFRVSTEVYTMWRSNNKAIAENLEDYEGFERLKDTVQVTCNIQHFRNVLSFIESADLIILKDATHDLTILQKLLPNKRFNVLDIGASKDVVPLDPWEIIFDSRASKADTTVRLQLIPYATSQVISLLRPITGRSYDCHNPIEEIEAWNRWLYYISDGEFGVMENFFIVRDKGSDHFCGLRAIHDAYCALGPFCTYRIHDHWSDTMADQVVNHLRKEFIPYLSDEEISEFEAHYHMNGRNIEYRVFQTLIHTVLEPREIKADVCLVTIYIKDDVKVMHALQITRPDSLMCRSRRIEQRFITLEQENRLKSDIIEILVPTMSVYEVLNIQRSEFLTDDILAIAAKFKREEAIHVFINDYPTQAYDDNIWAHFKEFFVKEAGRELTYLPGVLPQKIHYLYTHCGEQIANLYVQGVPRWTGQINKDTVVVPQDLRRDCYHMFNIKFVAGGVAAEIPFISPPSHRDHCFYYAVLFVIEYKEKIKAGNKQRAIDWINVISDERQRKDIDINDLEYLIACVADIGLNPKGGASLTEMMDVCTEHHIKLYTLLETKKFDREMSSQPAIFYYAGHAYIYLPNTKAEVLSIMLDKKGNRSINEYLSDDVPSREDYKPEVLPKKKGTFIEYVPKKKEEAKLQTEKAAVPVAKGKGKKNKKNKQIPMFENPFHGDYDYDYYSETKEVENRRDRSESKNNVENDPRIKEIMASEYIKKQHEDYRFEGWGKISGKHCVNAIYRYPGDAGYHVEKWLNREIKNSPLSWRDRKASDYHHPMLRFASDLVQYFGLLALRAAYKHWSDKGKKPVLVDVGGKPHKVSSMLGNVEFIRWDAEPQPGQMRYWCPRPTETAYDKQYYSEHPEYAHLMEDLKLSKDERPTKQEGYVYLANINDAMYYPGVPEWTMTGLSEGWIVKAMVGFTAVPDIPGKYGTFDNESEALVTETDFYYNARGNQQYSHPRLDWYNMTGGSGVFGRNELTAQVVTSRFYQVGPQVAIVLTEWFANTEKKPVTEIIQDKDYLWIPKMIITKVNATGAINEAYDISYLTSQIRCPTQLLGYVREAMSNTSTLAGFVNAQAAVNRKLGEYGYTVTCDIHELIPFVVAYVANEKYNSALVHKGVLVGNACQAATTNRNPDQALKKTATEAAFNLLIGFGNVLTGGKLSQGMRDVHKLQAESESLGLRANVRYTQAVGVAAGLKWPWSKKKEESKVMISELDPLDVSNSDGVIISSKKKDPYYRGGFLNKFFMKIGVRYDEAVQKIGDIIYKDDTLERGQAMVSEVGQALIGEDGLKDLGRYDLYVKCRLNISGTICITILGTLIKYLNPIPVPFIASIVFTGITLSYAAWKIVRDNYAYRKTAPAGNYQKTLIRHKKMYDDDQDKLVSKYYIEKAGRLEEWKYLGCHVNDERINVSRKTAGAMVKSVQFANKHMQYLYDNKTLQGKDIPCTCSETKYYKSGYDVQTDEGLVGINYLNPCLKNGVYSLLCRQGAAGVRPDPKIFKPFLRWVRERVMPCWKARWDYANEKDIVTQEEFLKTRAPKKQNLYRKDLSNPCGPIPVNSSAMTKTDEAKYGTTEDITRSQKPRNITVPQAGALGETLTVNNAALKILRTVCPAFIYKMNAGQIGDYMTEDLRHIHLNASIQYDSRAESERIFFNKYQREVSRSKDYGRIKYFRDTGVFRDSVLFSKLDPILQDAYRSDGGCTIAMDGQSWDNHQNWLLLMIDIIFWETFADDIIMMSDTSVSQKPRVYAYINNKEQKIFYSEGRGGMLFLILSLRDSIGSGQSLRTTLGNSERNIITQWYILEISGLEVNLAYYCEGSKRWRYARGNMVYLYCTGDDSMMKLAYKTLVPYIIRWIAKFVDINDSKKVWGFGLSTDKIHVLHFEDTEFMSLDSIRLNDYRFVMFRQANKAILSGNYTSKINNNFTIQDHDYAQVQSMLTWGVNVPIIDEIIKQRLAVLKLEGYKGPTSQKREFKIKEYLDDYSVSIFRTHSELIDSTLVRAMWFRKYGIPIDLDVKVHFDEDARIISSPAFSYFFSKKAKGIGNNRKLLNFVQKKIYLPNMPKETKVVIKTESKNKKNSKKNDKKNKKQKKQAPVIVKDVININNGKQQKRGRQAVMDPVLANLKKQYFSDLGVVKCMFNPEAHVTRGPNNGQMFATQIGEWVQTIDVAITGANTVAYVKFDPSLITVGGGGITMSWAQSGSWATLGTSPTMTTLAQAPVVSVTDSYQMLFFQAKITPTGSQLNQQGDYILMVQQGGTVILPNDPSTAMLQKFKVKSASAIGNVSYAHQFPQYQTDRLFKNSGFALPIHLFIQGAAAGTSFNLELAWAVDYVPLPSCVNLVHPEESRASPNVYSIMGDILYKYPELVVSTQNGYRTALAAAGLQRGNRKHALGGYLASSGGYSANGPSFEQVILQTDLEKDQIVDEVQDGGTFEYITEKGKIIAGKAYNTAKNTLETASQFCDDFGHLPIIKDGCKYIPTKGQPQQARVHSAEQRMLVN